jgi:hypothetical protein
MTQNYSDPASQQTLADALSQTSTYSPDNLIAALKAKGLTAPPQDAPPSGQTTPGGMPPWALDAPPVRTAAEQQRHVTPPTPQALMAMRQQQDAAAQKANAQRLQAAQMAPDMSRGASGAAPGAPTETQAPPPPAAPQTVPAHWVNTMDPASREAMAAGQQQQLGGVGGEAESEGAAARDMAEIARQGHDDARVQQLLDQQKLDPERQKLDEHARQLQAQAEKLANAKVDPEHYMAHQSAGAKVLMAIGMGLSGFGAGLRGGPNTSVDMIKSAIDDDNRAQMQNIDNSKTGLKDQQGILADKMRLFGNKEQALAAARQEQLQGVAAQIDDMARQYQSPTIQAKAEQLKGELRQHFAAEGAAVQKYVAQQTVGGAGATEDKVHALAAKYLGEGTYKSPDEAVAAARQVLGSQAPGSNADRIPGGKGGAGGVRALAKPIVNYQANVEGLKRLEELTGKTYLTAAEKGEANTLAANLEASGVKGLPQDIGRIDVGRLTGSEGASTHAARAEQLRKLKAARNFLENGGPGGAPEDDEGEPKTPPGFE